MTCLRTASRSPLLLVLASMALPVPAVATDHWDGPAVSKEPAADITDFFVFPTSASGQERLTLIMSVYPGAAPSTMFSDAVTYSFRLRAIEDEAEGGSEPYFETADTEFRVDCIASRSVTPQTMSCTASVLEPGTAPRPVASSTVGVADPSGGGNAALRVFAGPRADQSFTDLGRVRMPVWRDIDMSGRPGVNGLAGKNVLSIVVDLDLDRLVGERRGLWAAVSETTVAGTAPGPVRIDRMGRIEVTVFLIQDDRLKDLWNAEDTFAIDEGNAESYRAALQAGMYRLDDFEKSLTGETVIDWPQPHPMIELMLRDYLVVSLDGTTTPSSRTIGFLDNEIALLKGEVPSSLGGRVPNEDVISRMLTLFINGPDRTTPNRGVGVPSPGRPAIDAFPYVNPPYE